MFIMRRYLSYLVLVFFKIRILGAQQAPNTSSDQGIVTSSLQPRFSDHGAMGFPNFGSGGFGNPTSNYPMNSFSPFGNQNNNMQQPQQGFGLQNQNPNQDNYQNRPIQGGYPNQQGYPYGDDTNPSQNYQRPQYPSGSDEGSMYPNQYPNQGNFNNRPVQGDFPDEDGSPYQGGNMNQYPGYQRPSYPNRPNDASMYPGNTNRPYQYGGLPSNQDGNLNQPMLGQGRPDQFQYPQQGGQYPSQGNFQGIGNPNFRPDQQNPNFQPDEINNLPNTNIHFPDSSYQNQPNQYYPDNSLPNQNNPNLRQGQPNNFQPYQSYNNPISNIQIPTQPTLGQNGDPSKIQFPTSSMNPGGSVNVPNTALNPGNHNNIPQNQPQIPNNQGMASLNGPNYNNTVAILGKPVIVPSSTTLPGQVVFDNSIENPTQKKCVQDCQSTSEYNPVCGSNNVTYINPGKFVCARNCGEVVYLQQTGRCAGDAELI